ncbi:hypothetical protein YYG_02322 [Plasmodium vinckei petteri]|uniref:Uncharacterized protein n=1 Tax=Plasmodium vinckei petteri TaxID=138298 RepID=W7B3F2_PLAVN|nr:hypothetical protein YYG_02322 [Plasmodium vinckei petteri]CAD2109867.1 conserved Plasmodium protein, unknown function [Plasmodium vinckei petteri]
MIKIYPYPFSKYVKSLPDPPPHKSREIRKFECKKYENDYNWLLEAKNNLKKCFHLCNACSKKFNYMRCLVKNSNVHYEYILNDRILKNATKYGDEKEHRENVYNKNLCDDKNIDIQSHDIKSNILKIANNRLKCSMQSNKTTPSEKSIKDNSIIFSNSLNPNENDTLSFNDDVFIFLDSYSNYHKQNEDTYDNTKLQNINCLKYADNMPSQYEIGDMIIHIKRYFKNDISYFACKHLTMDDVCNLKDENNNYDNISVYIYDNRENSMNDCMINMSEGSEVYDLSQRGPMNIINGNEEDYVSNNLDDIWMNKYGNKPFLDKNYLNEHTKEKKISIESINENGKLYDISYFYNKKNFNNLMSLEGIKHNEDFINNIYETEIVGKKVGDSKNRVTIKNGKEQDDDYEDNSNIKNYEIKVKSFNIDETERALNLKLLEHIIKNKIPKKHKENELDIRMNIPHFHTKENSETLKKSKIIAFSNYDALYAKEIYDNIKDNKSEQKEAKDNKTSLNKKKTENVKIVNSCNLNDLCEKKNISNANGDNIAKVNRYTMKNGKGDNIDKKYICSKNNFSEEINDVNSCDSANQDNVSIISKNNTYNSLNEKYEVDLKKCANCTDSPNINSIEETNYDNTKGYSYLLNKNNVSASTKKENVSLINFNKAISKCINNKINFGKLNSNENEFFGKYKLNNNYLKHKEPIDKNKTKNNDIHSIHKKSKEICEHECKKYINKNSSNSNLIFDKEQEGKKEDGENESRKNNSRKKNHDTELKNKLNSILNICSIPNNINIHNKISTSDIEKIKLDSNKIVYINNNYFFNVKKNNYIDKFDTETTNNLMNYNIQKIDFQLCKNKNDIYCFKYMSNVLSNNSLSKESILNEKVESNILKGNRDKFNEIRKKYLLKKYLNEVLNKKNLHSINGRIHNVPNINRQNLSNNKIGKNIYDKNYIHTEKLDGNLYIKHKLNENKKNKKRNIKLEKAPESPQEQEKIPKPLASQLEVNSSSYLKKTPSYPFEEIN